jgi:hypothetical protein
MFHLVRLALKFSFQRSNAQFSVLSKKEYTKCKGELIKRGLKESFFRMKYGSFKSRSLKLVVVAELF